MKPSTILSAIALLLAFFAGSIYAPIDYERNQRAALLEQNRRLVNHFPDGELAQLATPVQGDER